MEARPYRKKLGKPVVFHFLVQQSTFSCSGHLILTNKLVLIYEASAVFELSFQMYKLDLERQNRDQTTNIHWIIEIARKFQKNIYFCFTLKALRRLLPRSSSFLWVPASLVLLGLGYSFYDSCLSSIML